MTGNLTLRRPGVWKFSYSIDGKRGYATIEAPNKRLAEREAAKLYAKALVEAKLAAPENWRVADLLRAWFKDHAPQLGSDHSRRNYRHTIENVFIPLIGDIPLAAYTSQHLLSVKARMLTDTAPRTVSQRWMVLRMAEAWAVRHEFLRESPAAKVEVPLGTTKPAQRYSLAQLQALDAVLAPPEGIVIALGMYAGLRIGEARGLRLVDVDALDYVLHVRWQLTRLAGRGSNTRLPKMGKQRTVEIVPQLERHFAETAAWHEAQGRALELDDFWGCQPLTHEPISAEDIYDYLHEAQERAGVPRLVFHAAGRHTYATIGREAGISDMDLAASLGHSTTAMLVRTYGNHPSEDRHAGMRAKRAAFLNSVDSTREAR